MGDTTKVVIFVICYTLSNSDAGSPGVQKSVKNQSVTVRHDLINTREFAQLAQYDCCSWHLTRQHIFLI